MYNEKEELKVEVERLIAENMSSDIEELSEMPPESYCRLAIEQITGGLYEWLNSKFDQSQVQQEAMKDSLKSNQYSSSSMIKQEAQTTVTVEPNLGESCFQLACVYKSR